MELRVIKKIAMLYWEISDFHEKRVVMKTILQFAQKISIIKKTIAHKVYKITAYSNADSRFWGG